MLRGWGGPVPQQPPVNLTQLSVWDGRSAVVVPPWDQAVLLHWPHVSGK